MTERERLVKAALSAREAAYAPYSGFRVGAALLCADGSVYTGCNIENAAFTPTVCAERVAFFKAISEGKRHFTAIAVAGGREAVVGTAPCGVCRQVFAEHCTPDFEVLIVTDGNGGYSTVTLEGLLPLAFGAADLNNG